MVIWQILVPIIIGTAIVLTVLTSYCYFGDGQYHHRQRYDLMPIHWILTLLTTGYIVACSLEFGPVWTYFSLMGGGLIGWISGEFVHRKLFMKAIYTRPERIFTQRYREEKRLQAAKQQG